jgi:hypothetical protein
LFRSYGVLDRAAWETAAVSSGDSDPDSRRPLRSLSLLYEAAERLTLHLLCRLPNRLFMSANPIGPLRHRVGRQVGAGLVLSDLTQGWLLYRGLLDGRRGRGLRLLLDIADAATVVALARFNTACGCQALFDTAPVSIETAYRRGTRRGLAAAAPIALTIGGLRAVRGWPHPGAQRARSGTATPPTSGFL